MELHLALSFLGASILLSLMPGPDNIFVLTESLTKGHKNGIAISIGLSLGVLIHTLATATGLSLIIQKSALAFSVVKYLGALYLFYLAYKATKDNQSDVKIELNQTPQNNSISALIKKGLFMNVLNPKVALFFIAFLPQFVSKTGYNITLQMIFLGIIFMLQAFVIFSLIAILSARLTPYLHNQRFWKITKWSRVGVLGSLGLVLMLSKK